MHGQLKGQTVLVVGRGGGLAKAVVLAARDAGAQVVAAGRNTEALATSYADESGISTDYVDLTDEASIAALGERIGTLDHVVDIAQGVLFAMTSTFLTGVTLGIDDGEPLS